jgi:hyperosmotically inducible protein
MKSQLAAGFIVLGLALAPAGFAADKAPEKKDTPTRTEKAKEAISDSVITTKIKAEMAKDKQVSALHIKVETDANGMVQLSGNAKSKAEADKAVALAKGVKGVKDVDNKIMVK